MVQGVFNKGECKIMPLNDFLTQKDILGEKYNKFLELKKKFQDEGLPENIAVYKASELLTADKLEKIKVLTENSEGMRFDITFFFDTAEELKLLAKYFQFNPHTKQVKEAKLLIELLKLMEDK